MENGVLDTAQFSQVHGGACCAQCTDVFGVGNFIEAVLVNRHAIGEAFDGLTVNHGPQAEAGHQLVAIRALHEIQAIGAGHLFQRKGLLETSNANLTLFVVAVIDVCAVNQIGIGAQGVGDQFVIDVFQYRACDTQSATANFKIVGA